MTQTLDASFFTSLVQQARMTAPVPQAALPSLAAGHTAHTDSGGEWITVAEADELGLISEDALRTAIRRGKIESRMDRRQRVVLRPSLEAYTSATYPEGQARRGRPRKPVPGPNTSTRQATPAAENSPDPDGYYRTFREFWCSERNWPDPASYHISDREAIRLQREISMEAK